MMTNGAETKPNFLIAGFQKCASTWLHRRLSEHPDIFIPSQHMIHYFDIHYQKGLDWYQDFFKEYSGQKCIGDATVSYIKHPDFCQRALEFNPEMKIILCLRNPIERAFSHYWHDKKKGRFNYSFEDYNTNYDLFETWIGTGFYDVFLERLFSIFNLNQISVHLTEDFDQAPDNELLKLATFLDIDPHFVSENLKKRENKASWGRYKPETNPLKKLLSPKKLFTQTYRDSDLEKQVFNVDLSEYKKGLDPAIRSDLIEMYKPHVIKLENLISRDLSHWLE